MHIQWGHKMESEGWKKKALMGAWDLKPPTFSLYIDCCFLIPVGVHEHDDVTGLSRSRYILAARLNHTLLFV